MLHRGNYMAPTLKSDPSWSSLRKPFQRFKPPEGVEVATAKQVALWPP